MAVVFGILFVVLLKLIMMAWSKCDEWDRMPVGLFGTIGVVLLLVGAVISSFCALKVAVAPRVVVLEKIATLVK
jgi:hypothetical protein